MRLISAIRDSRDLSDRLRDAAAVTPDLMSDVICEACWRFPPVRRTEKAARIERLIKSAAWIDAALALIEHELPQWKLRRIAYDDGEWSCALSRQRELPDWLDQSIEARHVDLSLAILGAFVEAQGVVQTSNKTSVPTVRLVASPPCARLCCENFA